jgi:hypothetical protein
MSTEFLGVNPVLPVKSVVDTAKFFQDKLGFTIDVIWDGNTIGVVRRGNVVIELGGKRPDQVGGDICIIRVDNADSIYKEWKSKDIEFVGDYSEREYGSKDFRIKDNNGNMLIVGHALENQLELVQAGNVA